MAEYLTYITKYPKLQVTATYPYYDDGTLHNGFDTKTPNNADTNVFSPVSGRVIRSELGSAGTKAYGEFIMIYNDDDVGEDWDNSYTYLAAHFYLRAVKVGQYINKGDYLGIYGQTGNATGPHVHSEILKGYGFNTGVRWNPAPYIGVPNAKGIYNVKFGGGSGPGPIPPPPHRGKNYMPIYYYLRRR